jgi:molecular chaperone DnaK
MRRVIGIDLGTTYSCVAVFNEAKGVFEVLPSKSGQQTTPSVVGLNPRGEVIVGDAAKRQFTTKPGNTVAEIKRRMGELGSDGKPYTVMFGGREHTPEEISAYILRDLREAAERALGGPVEAAVITVPAYFEEPQRQATMRAGQLAGLEVKRVINEPTAAAIAYGHDKDDEDEDSRARPTRLMIYDLGGGTFDVSLIEVEGGHLRVKATHGNHYLGGVDFDRAIATWACAQIKAQWGIDIEQLTGAPGKQGDRGREALARIRGDAETYKRDLSSQDTATMQWALLPVIDPRTGEMLERVELELTRAQFEAMIAGKIDETIESVDVALRDAKLCTSDIDEVVLVGGSTRIPMVKQRLARHFGKEPRTNIHPDLCVAIGAAHEAVKHVDAGAVAANLRKKLVRAVSEVVSVIDVTGHSLGVGVIGDAMSVLVPRQSPIPTMRTKTYETSEDNQTIVRVQVYQGEHDNIRNNTKLREFDLVGLPARPRGTVKIDITFALDSNDTLTVTAVDKATNQQNEVVIRDERLRAVEAKAMLPSAGHATPPAPNATPAPTPPPPPARSPNTVAAAIGAATPTLASGTGDLAATERAPGAPLVIPARYRRFVEQAERLVPSLATMPADKLRDALAHLQAAVCGGSDGAIEDAGDKFLDVLFEVRP